MKILCLTTSMVCLAMMFPFASIDDKSLVLYLPFNEGEGTVAKDYSGNGNDGDISRAKWVEGKIGSALEFDGVNSGVKIKKADSIEPSEAISITTWLRINNSNGNHEIVRKQTPNGKS